MSQETSIKIIVGLGKEPSKSKRRLSKKCGISPGSIHYFMAHLCRGWYVKGRYFKDLQNKMAHAYFFTPLGINLKKEFTLAFFKCKETYVEALRTEITLVEKDLAG
jgi:hypothetical protein